SHRNAPVPLWIYPRSLHDALPISHGSIGTAIPPAVSMIRQSQSFSARVASTSFTRDISMPASAAAASGAIGLGSGKGVKGCAQVPAASGASAGRPASQPDSTGFTTWTEPCADNCRAMNPATRVLPMPVSVPVMRMERMSWIKVYLRSLAHRASGFVNAGAVFVEVGLAALDAGNKLGI